MLLLTCWSTLDDMRGGHHWMCSVFRLLVSYDVFSLHLCLSGPLHVQVLPQQTASCSISAVHVLQKVQLQEPRPGGWRDDSVDKVLALQAWRPEFDPQDSHKGGGRELTSQSCPLTSTYPLWHTHAHIQTRMPKQ